MDLVSSYFLKKGARSLIMAVFLGVLIFVLQGCNDDITEDKSKGAKPAVKSVNQDDSQKDELTDVVSQEISEKEKNHSAFSWEKLSGWHTQGTIPSDKPISIVFNRDVVDEGMVGKDASKIMHISPKIDGNPVFESTTEILWVPTKKLKPGVEYKVRIKAAGLKDVPAKTSPYQFSFHIIPLEFEVKTFGLIPVSSEDGNRGGAMRLKGQLLVSDHVEPDNAKQMLTATQQSKPLLIEWNHSSDGKKHGFTIGGIQRESFATDIKLAWNGKALNIKSQGMTEISVPAIDEFKFTKMRVIHGDGINPYVQVDFSDKLDSDQNLKGLVKLAKNKYKVRAQDNVIKIYPNKNLSGSFKVTLSEGIRGEKGQVLKKSIEQNVVFDDIKPQVRFVGKGSILPENATLEIPFEAVSVNAVEVTAFEIYPENMRQFLQVNRLSGKYQTRRSGRYLWSKTIPLTPADPNKWNRYSFDATEIMKSHHAGLLRLTLKIKRQHSTYDCPPNTPKPKFKKTLLKNYEDNGMEEVSGWDGISDYAEGYNNYNYSWNNRHKPCTDSYYQYNQNKTQVSQNFIASNIGLIAKLDGEGSLSIVTTDIRTSKPLTGVELEVRNYQGQVMANAKSDGSGFAKMELSGTPFLLVAQKFKDTAYLKVNARTALSVSHFDVGGKKIKKGIKGFIYGERGVWRPGDDIYLTFVLQDKVGTIPAEHPVSMKLIDPRGRVVETQTLTESVGGFYAFKFKTREKAETGRWMAKAFLGGSTFSKSLMIETVRPNRLKVDLQFLPSGLDDNAENTTSAKKSLETLYKSDGVPRGKLFSQWLHGAKASNLKTDVSLRFSSKRTKFGRFTDYSFDDPARRLESKDKTLFEGRLDNEGYLEFQKDIQPKALPPGMLKANFTSRVFEEGGAFSISRSSVDYHPYENYVGVKLPKGDATRNMLLTDKQHTVEIASLNAKGESVSLSQVQVKLYKVKWKWWWDKSAETLAEYADGKNTGLLKQEIVSTVDGVGSWNFSIKYPEWGRYLIRVCDLEGRHCSGKTVFIDWPGWAGRAQEQGSSAASRLNLFSDKSAYKVGETATIQVPSASRGRALLTVETGSQILEQRWIEFDASNTSSEADSKTKVDIPVTAEMSPNAYVHISLLQPHKDKNNDRPIRLYGIIPLEVADPETYLKPTLEVADEWRPESTQKIKVSELNGKEMNYTLAVVDEGLLGLTGFKTPDLHKYFYSKEALGIKTWDLFDEVIGAYGGKLERMLALGGGDEAEVDNEDSKKRRFPPVVRVLGPFHLAKGETVEHDVTLPPYLGAVRVMLVAGEKGAYGKTQKSVFVRQALMLQASLPRVLGTNEEISVPLSVFAMNDSVKDVSITVKTDDLVDVIGDEVQSISFSSQGEKLAFLKLKTANVTGKTHVKFIATSTNGNGRGKQHKSEVDLHLDIRNANQETTRSISKVIEPGTSWEGDLKPYGLKGTNHALLELSSVPALNLEKRLGYLIKYPHGCLEQTTSSAFPQLYLSNIVSLDDERKQKIEHHINRALEMLKRFQNGTGEFNYWPGGNNKNNWASIYAGHFLIEAKKQGYLVPPDMLSSWLTYQVDAAQSYVVASERVSHVQAYRLYVLALAGKPQMGAMNRLRESSKLNRKARWMLASAYQTASQPDAAKALIQGLQSEVPKVESPDSSFSSTLGDLGIQLESLVVLNKKQDANQVLEKIAEEMGGDEYQNTQGIAWALMSVSRYLGGDTSNFTAKVSQGDESQDIDSKKAISTQSLAFTDAPLKVENTSGIKLFATLLNQGIPAAGDEQSLQQGLLLTTRYEKRISTGKANSKRWNEFDISQPVLQGSDIRVTVTVSNDSKRSTDNIALTIPVAAGMEIFSVQEQPQTKSKYDHRDLRDDRIHYYFSLAAGKSKSFQLVVNASYKGRYYLPAVNAEAMYDGKMRARENGQWLNIVKEIEDSKSDEIDSKEGNESKPNGSIRITVEKSWLYEKAEENSRTKMYLVKGDEAELLDKSKAADNTRWYLVRFKGKKLIEKWIRAETTE